MTSLAENRSMARSIRAMPCMGEAEVGAGMPRGNGDRRESISDPAKGCGGPLRTARRDYARKIETLFG